MKKLKHTSYRYTIAVLKLMYLKAIIITKKIQKITTQSYFMYGYCQSLRGTKVSFTACIEVNLSK